jgi:hypothetical protein
MGPAHVLVSIIVCTYDSVCVCVCVCVYACLCNTHNDTSTWTFRIPFQSNYIVTADPRNVEYVLKTNFDNFIKGA